MYVSIYICGSHHDRHGPDQRGHRAPVAAAHRILCDPGASPRTLDGERLLHNVNLKRERETLLLLIYQEVLERESSLGTTPSRQHKARRKTEVLALWALKMYE